MNQQWVAPTVAFTAAYLKPDEHCGSLPASVFPKVRQAPHSVERQNRVSSSMSEPRLDALISTGKKQTTDYDPFGTQGGGGPESNPVNRGAKALRHHVEADKESRSSGASLQTAMGASRSQSDGHGEQISQEALQPGDERVVDQARRSAQTSWRSIW